MEVSIGRQGNEADARSDQDEQRSGGPLAVFLALRERMNALVDVPTQDGLRVIAVAVIPHAPGREALDEFGVPEQLGPGISPVFEVRERADDQGCNSSHYADDEGDKFRRHSRQFYADVPTKGCSPQRLNPLHGSLTRRSCRPLEPYSMAMGYETVRGHSRRGRIGGTTVRGSIRFTDRPARRPRSRSPYYPGYRSASPTPILWALAALFGGVILLLVVLTLTHLGSPDRAGDTAVVPATVAPAHTTAPPTSCFPFQTSPC